MKLSFPKPIRSQQSQLIIIENSIEEIKTPELPSFWEYDYQLISPKSQPLNINFLYNGFKFFI